MRAVLADGNRSFRRCRFGRTATAILLSYAVGAIAAAGPAAKTAQQGPQTAVSARPSAVTYARNVAPILQSHCQSCHRPGQVAPFTLMTYEQAKARAAQIKETTLRHVMPPWRAEPGYGAFRNARGLTDREIGVLAQWVDAGAPAGDLRKLPPPRSFTDGWTLGQPDLVLEPEAPFTLPAEGEDVYRYFVLPAQYSETRYIAAVEARPGNRAVVHHVMVYVDTSGMAETLDRLAPGPGFSGVFGLPFEPYGQLGSWAPGNIPNRLPDGVGCELPANARIVMEVHYHKTGKPETDRTRLGVYFAHGKVDQKLHVAQVLNPALRIPAGEGHFEVRAAWTAPEAIHARWVIPHMHLLGREFKVSATLPDGTVKPIVWVKNWDFNWRENYVFKEPVALPAGTRIELVASYDNSEKNPRNPHRPPRDVTWGPQATDEMCVAFVSYTVDSEHLAGPSSPAAAKPGIGQTADHRSKITERR